MAPTYLGSRSGEALLWAPPHGYRVEGGGDPCVLRGLGASRVRDRSRPGGRGDAGPSHREGRGLSPVSFHPAWDPPLQKEAQRTGLNGGSSNLS